MRTLEPRHAVDLDTVRVPRGQVSVIALRCKGCGFCIEFCPNDVLTESDATNAKGYRLPVVAPDKQQACAYCQFCTLVCPEFAIFVESCDAATEVDA